MFYYFELLKVTVTDGPVSVLPPPSHNCPKVTNINSWELIDKKLPIPLLILYYFEFIREVLANTLYLFCIYEAYCRFT